MGSSTREMIVLLVTVLPVGVLGCGEGKDPHGRQALTGTVTFQGHPLGAGSIKFLPAQDKGLSAGALIRDGRYAIPREQGLAPGTYRVLISALEPTPVPAGAPGSDPAPPAKELIPAEYNLDTRLRIEVKADQENNFAFTIK
jgi:hypothetical protein